MIGKITAPRGTRLAPLVYYLFGPGRREEHTDPHLVAGWRHPAELEPPLRPDGSRNFRRLLGLLAQPHAAMGEFAMARPVWHCSLRAAPEDKMLSDEWAQIAGDVMHRTGLSQRGAEDEGVRWIAVRHGPDHVHLVAMLARQDFRRPRLDFERYRVREACQAAEIRYGLRATAPGDRTAATRPSRAESEKAARRGLGEPPRVTLRRAVTTAAACVGSEQEFFTRLELAGVLARKRFSTRNPGQVTGYAVALPGDTSRSGGPVWYGGGKLAPDLTWPKLRHRWAPSSAAGERFTPAERAAIWEHAAGAAGTAAAEIRALASTTPAAAADAAWAASSTPPLPRCAAAPCARPPTPMTGRHAPPTAASLPRPGRWAAAARRLAAGHPGPGHPRPGAGAAYAADPPRRSGRRGRPAPRRPAPRRAGRRRPHGRRTAACRCPRLPGRATAGAAVPDPGAARGGGLPLPHPARPAPARMDRPRPGRATPGTQPHPAAGPAARPAPLELGARRLRVPVTGQGTQPGSRWGERVNFALAPPGLPAA
jgi:hypothetical protein